MAGQKVLGVDLGQRRVGVALGGEVGLMAHPLCVLEYRGQDRLADSLSELASANEAGSFVVGLPRNMDGSLGEAARRAVRFARKLERRSGLAVVLSDERLTTSQAEKEMIALGKSRKSRRMTIDEVAAVLILENYLRREALRRQGEGQ